jgi:hypothetical protein
MVLLEQHRIDADIGHRAQRSDGIEAQETSDDQAKPFRRLSRYVRMLLTKKLNVMAISVAPAWARVKPMDKAISVTSQRDQA